MIPALANLQPEPIWRHFDRLAAIPRASTKEAAARDYVCALATKLGFESVLAPHKNTLELGRY
jgi:dipeptidase D